MSDRRLCEELFVTSTDAVDLSHSEVFSLPVVLRFWRPRMAEIHVRSGELTGFEVAITPEEMTELATYWLAWQNNCKGNDNE